MPDPLSIAANVTALLGIVIKGSGELWDYFNALRHAPSHIQNTAATLKACHVIVRELQHVRRQRAKGGNLDGYDDDSSPMERPLEDFRKTCDSLRQKLEPYQLAVHGKTLNLSKRISWTLRKSRIEALRRELEGHQRILSILLEVKIHKTVQEMHSGDEGNIGKILYILRKMKDGSTISDDDARQLKDGIDLIEKQIGNPQDYGAVSDPPTAPASINNISPRISRVGSPPPPNIMSVIERRVFPNDYPTLPSRDVDFNEALTTQPRYRSHYQNDEFVTEKYPDFRRSPKYRRSIQALDAKDRPVISAPVDVNDPYRDTHRVVRDHTGHRGLEPRRAPPEMRTIQSAPTEMFDKAVRMERELQESRAYIEDHLNRSDARVERALRSRRTVASLVPRPYDQGDVLINLRGAPVVPRNMDALTIQSHDSSPRKTFEVYNDDQTAFRPPHNESKNAALPSPTLGTLHENPARALVSETHALRPKDGNQRRSSATSDQDWEVPEAKVRVDRHRRVPRSQLEEYSPFSAQVPVPAPTVPSSTRAALERQQNIAIPRARTRPQRR